MTTVSTIATVVLAENNFNTDATTTAVTAALILSENSYTISDITAVNLEYLIDNSINYINLITNTSQTALTGEAGSKTVTVTKPYAVILKELTTLMIRAYKDRGPNVGLGGLSVNTIINDPQYSLFSDIIKTGLNRLKTFSAANVEKLIDNAILHINSTTGISVAALTGSAGSKSLVATDNQIIAIKTLSSMILRDSLGQPPSALQQTLFQQSLAALRNAPIYLSNDPTPT